MVRSLDKRWNIVLPKLCKLFYGLEDLGSVSVDDDYRLEGW